MGALDEFELRIAAAQDDGGTWTELALWTLYDARNVRGLSEIKSPGEASDHEYFGAIFLDGTAAVFEMTLLGVNVFPDEIRGPTSAEVETLQDIDPTALRDHIGALLAELTPVLVEAEAAQFGVITRVDVDLPASQALEIVPPAIRADLPLHLIDSDQVSGTVPLSVVFDDGRLSSATFTLDLLVQYLDTELPSEALTIRMEVVRGTDLLDSLLGSE